MLALALIVETCVQSCSELNTGLNIFIKLFMVAQIFFRVAHTC
jgi:hypothetical protein